MYIQGRGGKAETSRQTGRRVGEVCFIEKDAHRYVGVIRLGNAK